MPSSPAQVRADFDRIAAAQRDRSTGIARYFGWVLSQAPMRVGSVLDIGCGAGDLCAALSPRAERVLGVDLSPEMLDLARRNCSGRPNIEFRLGDILEMDLPAEAFDLIVSMTTLHHVPLKPALHRIVQWLRPGGRLLVVDLRRSVNYRDALVDVFGATVLAVRSHGWIARRGQVEAETLWREHGAREEYLSTGEVAEACRGLLPNATIRWRLCWRYTLRWTKPESQVT